MSQENLQNEGVAKCEPLVGRGTICIPLPLSDDDSSDEDMEVDSDEGYDDFWKDQKVIVGGQLANPMSEQMRHSPILPQV